MQKSSKNPVFFLLLSVILISACTNAIGPELEGTPPESERYIAVGVSGTILVSDDNGATFTPVTSGTTEVLRGVAADNTGHCVVVGMNGTVLYSDDYGNTWDTGSVSTINTINRVICYGTNKFMAVGEPTGPDPYGIFKSTDGGKNWNRTVASITLKGIANRSSTDFVVVGNIYMQNEAASYLTYNTGTSWSSVYNETNGDYPAGTGYLRDVVATITSYFVAVGSGGSVYSNDGGSWTSGGTISGTLYAVAWSSSPGRLIAVGLGSGGGVSKGRIFYSGSFGTTWTEVNPGTIEFLFDVATDGNGQFVAVGAAGEVMYSLDTGDISESGLNWAEGTSGVSVELYGVCYVPQ